jgi:hypothetical protein
MLRHPFEASITHIILAHCYQGIQGDPRINQVCFDSDSFPIRVNNHPSYCMVNSLHLLENPIFSDKGMVDGINEGLEIWGKRTYKFTIGHDNGRPHNIRIPNSLYVPGLKKYLVSPQHWAQEAADNKTWMGNFAHCCILHWCGGQKTVPFSTSTSTPTFFIAPSLHMYQAFALHLRPWRPHSSRGRQSFKFLDTRF